MYGKSLPTIKRWWSKGLPLDDPDAMGEYLSPRGRKADEDFEAPSIVPSQDPTDLDELPLSLDKDFFAGEGALAAIERLKKAERERAGAYFQAIKVRAMPTVLKNRFMEWTGIIEALRKLAKDEPDIRKANDLTIDKSEMEATLSALFAAFRMAARNLPTRAAAKLLAVERSREDYVAILNAEVDVLLRTLTDIAVSAAKAGDVPPPKKTRPSRRLKKERQ